MFINEAVSKHQYIKLPEWEDTWLSTGVYVMYIWRGKDEAKPWVPDGHSLMRGDWEKA